MKKKSDFDSNTASVKQIENQTKSKGYLLKKTLNLLFVSDYEDKVIKS